MSDLRPRVAIPGQRRPTPSARKAVERRKYQKPRAQSPGTRIPDPGLPRKSLCRKGQGYLKVWRSLIFGHPPPFRSRLFAPIQFLAKDLRNGPSRQKSKKRSRAVIREWRVQRARRAVRLDSRATEKRRCGEA